MQIRNGYSTLLGVVLGVAVLVVAVNGCTDRTAPIEVACPHVILNHSISNLTQFRDGQGRDLTDIAFESEIIGYSGICRRTADNVEMTLRMRFAATRGPVFEGNILTWPYFVAVVYTPLPPVRIRTNLDSSKRIPIPPQVEDTAAHGHPMVLAKAVFNLTSAFSSGLDNVHLCDEKITLTLPVHRTESLERHQIFVGFQLTPEQLQANKQKQQK